MYKKFNLFHEIRVKKFCYIYIAIERVFFEFQQRYFYVY